MAVRYYLDDVELVGAIEVHALEEGLVSSAAGADAGSSGISIDDPAGTLNIVGWHRFHVEEDTATPARIWTGFIGARDITDGGLIEAPGVGRTWDCTLLDLNMILGLECFRFAGAHRGEETDIARLDWALTYSTGGLAGRVFDNGFINRNFPHPVDADELRKKYPVQMLEALAADRRAFFLYHDETAPQDEKISIFYGFPATSRGLLDAKISNDESDGTAADGVFAPLAGWKLNREPGFTYSGVYLTTKAGSIYKSNSDTADTFIRRDLVVENDRIGKPATAEWFADLLLERGSTERDVLTLSIEVDAAQANAVREGFTIRTKITNLPGYDTFQTIMVQRRTVKRAPGTTDRYQLDLTLSNVAPFTGAGGGGGDPGDFPHPPSGPVSVVQQGLVISSGITPTFDMDEDPGVGNLIVLTTGWRDSAPQSIPTGFTQVGPNVTAGDGLAMCWRIVQPGDTKTIVYPTIGSKQRTTAWIELAGAWPADPVDVFDSDTGPGIAPSVSITPTSGANGVVIGGAENSNTNTPWDVLYVAGTGYTITGSDGAASGHPVVGAAYRVVPNAQGAYSPNMTATSGFPGDGSLSQWGMIAAFFKQDAAAGDPPSKGQWVYDEPITMSGAFGTTRFRFAAGSLTVKVDIDPQPLKSFDGDCNEFELYFDPDEARGQQVFATYQAI